jgi:hypothetical protein
LVASKSIMMCIMVKKIVTKKYLLWYVRFWWRDEYSCIFGKVGWKTCNY